jgi:hypothetical protein
MLACVLIPLIPSDMLKSEKLIIGVSGAISLVLSKVHGYAKIKTEEYENMATLLRAVRYDTPDEPLEYETIPIADEA